MGKPGAVVETITNPGACAGHADANLPACAVATLSDFVICTCPFFPYDLKVYLRSNAREWSSAYAQTRKARQSS